MLSIFSNLFSFLGRNLGYWCFYLLKFRFLKCFVKKSVFWSRCRSEPSFYRWSRSRIFLPRARAEKKISGDRAGAEEKWLSSATLVVHIVLLLYFYFFSCFCVNWLSTEVQYTVLQVAMLRHENIEWLIASQSIS